MAQLGDFVAYVNEDNIMHWMIITQIDRSKGEVLVTYHTPNKVNVELLQGKNVMLFMIQDSK